jgi:hypothetical protein
VLGVAVAIDGLGDPSVIIASGSGTSYDVAVFNPANGGGWARILLQSISTSATRVEVAAAANRAGDALALWQDYTSGAARLRSALRSHANYLWSAPALVSHEGLDAQMSRLVIDERGRGTAVWVEASSTTMHPVYAARFDGSQWVTQNGQDPRPSPDSKYGLPPAVAVDASGNTLVLWQDDQVAGRYDAQHLQAGTFSGVVLNSPFAADTGSLLLDPPSLAAGPDGTALVVWNETTSTTPKLLVTEFQ